MDTLHPSLLRPISRSQSYSRSSSRSSRSCSSLSGSSRSSSLDMEELRKRVDGVLPPIGLRGPRKKSPIMGYTRKTRGDTPIPPPPGTLIRRRTISDLNSAKKRKGGRRTLTPLIPKKKTVRFAPPNISITEEENEYNLTVYCGFCRGPRIDKLGLISKSCPVCRTNFLGRAGRSCHECGAIFCANKGCTNHPTSESKKKVYCCGLVLAPGTTKCVSCYRYYCKECREFCGKGTPYKKCPRCDKIQ